MDFSKYQTLKISRRGAGNAVLDIQPPRKSDKPKAEPATA